MKKTATLFAIAVLISSATFAQYNHPRNNNGHEVVVIRDHDRNDRGFGKGGYYFTAKERDREIASINREYFNRIQSVKGKLFMSRSKKDRLIYNLEMDRSREVRNVIAKFNDRKNFYDRRNDRFYDRDRGRNW